MIEQSIVMWLENVKREVTVQGNLPDAAQWTADIEAALKEEEHE